MHMLESHVPCYMDRYQNLGLLGEDPIERLHHTNNMDKRMTANIPGWKNQVIAISKRRSLLNTAEVKAALANALEATKRRKHNVDQDAINAQAEAENNVKRDNYIAAVDELLDLLRGNYVN